MRSQLVRATLLVLTTLLPTGAAAQNSLIVGTLVSEPPDAQVNVRVERGRKALRVRMRWIDNNTGIDVPGGNFPINIASATATLTINNGAPLSCTRNDSNPGVGACGFVARTFSGNPGSADTVWVYHNGNFPVSAPVQVAVSDVRGFNGAVQDPSTNTISFTTGNLAARTPAAMEIVMDISGSMGEPADPSAAVPTRLAEVQRAASALFDMLGGHAMLGDQIGVTFFSTTPSGGTLTAAHNPADVDAARTSVAGQVPTNRTAIGLGLNLANSAGLALAPMGSRKFVMLFSDGMQNEPPNVTAMGALQVGGANYPADADVCPIHAGEQPSPGFTLQQQIAAVACGGNNLHVDAASDFNTFFTQVLTDALIGDKLEIVRNATGSIAPGGTRSETFPVNTRDTALSLLLSWSGPRTSESSLALQLTAPNGTVVDVAPFTRVGPRSRFVTLHLPLRVGGTLVPPQGDWKLDLSHRSPAIAAVDYQLLVVTDNETLASEHAIGTSDPGTGEPIPLRVTLTEGGAPVTGATVTAELLGPANGLGDTLAKATLPGTPAAAGPDPLNSAAKVKLALLMADPAFRALIQPQPLPTVTLTESGGNGVYSGSFAGANKEGHYQFQVKVRGTTAANGPFERTRRVSVFVRAKPDSDRTDLVLLSSVPQSDNSVLVTLRATPRDRFGGLLGPDYPPLLAINSSAGTVATPLSDRLDGSYDITYRLPAGADPTITLDIMGTTVKNAPLSDIAKGVFGRYAVSLHAAMTLPHGTLNNNFDPSVSFGFDFEYRFNSTLSLETYVGHDRFSHASGGDDHWFTNLSGRVRFTGGTGPGRPFVFAGVGVYFDPDDAHVGESFGGGMQARMTSTVFIEATYTFHNVHLSGDDARYSTLTGGVRIRF